MAEQQQRNTSRAEAPYLRIVAALRLRIASGELRPGDRTPSTREIARSWGVAMATATKVLAELRREGLVRPVPGVGTVVESVARTRRSAPPGRAAGPARTGTAAPGTATPYAAPSATPSPPVAGTSGRAPAPDKGLARDGDLAPDRGLAPERIIATAIAVADAEGLTAVSMRRVAGELGAATMSLYRHVADKDDLLTQMMEAACSEWRFPADPPAGWRERLELAARLLWKTFRRHPWLASALSVTRPQLLVGAMPFTEWVLQALDGRGLDDQAHFTMHITLFTYVRGTAINIEPEVAAEDFTGLTSDEWMDTQGPRLRETFAAGAFPTLERVAAAGYDFDLDGLFEFGLQRLLDGFSAFLDTTPRHPDAPAPCPPDTVTR